MKLSLFTNSFMHDGVKHVSASIMVKRSGIEIMGVFSTSAYATENSVFECAFQTATTARSLVEMFENLGHSVEVEAPLADTTTLIDLLRAKVSE